NSAPVKGRDLSARVSSGRIPKPLPLHVCLTISQQPQRALQRPWTTFPSSIIEIHTYCASRHCRYPPIPAGLSACGAQRLTENHELFALISPNCESSSGQRDRSP